MTSAVTLAGCPCGVGFKQCQGACIPVASCCTNADCPVANGTLTCVAVSHQCGAPITCNDAFKLCSTACILQTQCCTDADCPAVDNADVTCAGYACRNVCRSGFQRCGEACISSQSCCSQGS